MTNIIKLDVSGKFFEVPYEILMRIPYFKYMFDDCISTNTIFLARSSHIFKHILALAIDPLYPYPDVYYFELDFYGMNHQKNTMLDNLKTMVNGLRDYLQDKNYVTDSCGYHDCKLYRETNSLFCIEHLNICAYKSTDEECYKSETDIKYNYCDYHSKIGYLCNRAGCFNLRIFDSKFCSDYCQSTQST